MTTTQTAITIIDYGLGNLHSIQRAFNHFGIEPTISNNPELISTSDSIVLPGVGAFGDGMSRLREKNLISVIQNFSKSGKPILGICLGMQLLLSESEEYGLHQGLDIIPGRVVRFPDPTNNQYKIPNIGWCKIEMPSTLSSWKQTILKDNNSGDYMYFVHSYISITNSEKDILGFTCYDRILFSSVIQNGNIYGCQFHPEKSGTAGLKIIQSFIDITQHQDI